MCELKLPNLTAALLDPLLARDPMGPRITYYDDATGERIELSAVTLANWAAKTANLLREELGGLPVKSDSSVPAGTVRVVLSEDYSGPGSGLEGASSTAQSVQDMSGAADTSDDQAPLPSQVFTAGSEDPQCVN